MEIEQRSDEWFEARRGKATASRFKDVLAKIGKGEAAARRNYRAQLVIERITGKTPDRFISAAMVWGQETEDLAAVMYSLRTGNLVEKVGFIESTILQAGASPDGLVGKEGTLEIKCFNTANHIEALKTGVMPAEHMPQVQGQLWLSARQWCDFVSFDPDMPENAQIFIQRIERDEVYILKLKSEVAAFLEEVDADVAFLTNYGKKLKEAKK